MSNLGLSYMDLFNLTNKIFFAKMFARLIKQELKQTYCEFSR